MTDTDLCNGALGQIGANRITSLTDGSVGAIHCTTFLTPLLEAMLRSRDWKFARKQAQLTLDATAPLFGYNYRFALPSDCLKVREYLGGGTTSVAGVDWKIEGRYVLSNDSVAYIAYTRRVTSPDDCDPLFNQALETWLASKLANAMTKDPAKANDLLTQALTVLLPEAQAVDGQEGTVEAYTVDDLTVGR